MTRPRTLALQAAFLIALGAVTFLSLWPTAPQVGPSDKLDHLAAYFVLALLADVAFAPKLPWLAWTVGVAAYGLLMEVLQRFVPGRFFEGWDIAANAAGVLLYLAARLVVRKRRVLAQGPRGGGAG